LSLQQHIENSHSDTYEFHRHSLPRLSIILQAIYF